MRCRLIDERDPRVTVCSKQIIINMCRKENVPLLEHTNSTGASRLYTKKKSEGGPEVCALQWGAVDVHNPNENRILITG